MKKLNLKAITTALVAACAFVALPSMAAAIDVTEVTTAMTDAGGAVGTIGAGSLVVSVGVKVWKWVARAL